MKNALLFITILCASCTVVSVPSEQKFWNSDYLIKEAYTKTSKQKMPIEGAKLKFFKEKIVVLYYNDEELKGTWKLSSTTTDEFGTTVETLYIDIKDKNNQRILFGQTDSFRKLEMTLRGNIDGKTRIFKLMKF